MCLEKCPHFIPRKASTWLAMPLIAFRKMSGKCSRHGWLKGSTPSARDTTHCINCGVLLTNCGEHNAIGDPIVRKNRYHVCAMQSFVIPTGISCASSSTEMQLFIDLVKSKDFVCVLNSIFFAYIFLAAGMSIHTKIQATELSKRDSRDSIVQLMQCDALATGMTLAMSSIMMATESYEHRQWATPQTAHSILVHIVDRWRHPLHRVVPIELHWSPTERVTTIPMFLVLVFVMIEPLVAVCAAHDDTKPPDDLSNQHLHSNQTISFLSNWVSQWAANLEKQKQNDEF